MSVQREVPRHDALSGLKLKRKLGEKIVIHHKGDLLILQVSAFYSGFYVQLAFEDTDENFTITRGELLPEVTS